MKQNQFKLSIVIGGYNEEKKIELSLRAILDFIPTITPTYEIIFVDDGSTDQTPILVATLVEKYNSLRLIRNMQNQGKGAVIRQGIKEATGDIIVITDADLAYPITQLKNFITATKEYDLIVGTRIHKNSVYMMNYTCFNLLFFRHMSSRIFNTLVQLLFNLNRTDTQCGIKVVRREVAQNIAKKLTINRFSYDVELFLIAKKKNARVIELPIQVYYSDTDSKISVVKHAPEMFFDVLRIKYNDLCGVYDKK